MTLDYYLVRFDRKELFELGSGQWSTIFPTTHQADIGSHIERFGAKTAAWLEERLLSCGWLPVGSDDSAAYVKEACRRIAAFTKGAPGLYCISDAGDHYGYVQAHHYQVVGTRYAKIVGDWWVSQFENRTAPPVHRHDTVIARHRIDGWEQRMVFVDRDEDAYAAYAEITADGWNESRAYGEQLKNAAPANAPKPLERNAPCACGSGRKFKHCCIGKQVQ